MVSTISKFFFNFNFNTVSAAVMGSIIKLVVPQEHVYRYIRGVQFCFFPLKLYF